MKSIGMQQLISSLKDVVKFHNIPLEVPPPPGKQSHVIDHSY